MAVSPSTVHAGSELIRFGAFELDLRSRELRRKGRNTGLPEQSIKVLHMLLQRPGEVVLRQEIRARLWPNDTVVEFDHSINTALRKLRAALSDSADSPRYIETLARRGYRWIGPPRSPQAPNPAADAPQRAAPQRSVAGICGESGRLQSEALPMRSQPWGWQRTAGVCAAAVILAAAVVGVWWSIAHRERAAGEVPRAAAAAAVGASPQIRSLAVLPLENLSGDRTQDYFADALTDQLITDLGQIAALRVISRTSSEQYKGARKPLAQIARELRVDALIEGAVTRSGNRVRITAQLIEAPSDRHLWARTYEGDVSDVLALQDRVAADVADEIRVRLTAQERAVLQRTRVAKPAAYEAYALGRHYWDTRSTRGIALAIEAFREAIRDDPDFALPYAALAEVYAALPGYQAIPPRESYDKAEAAAAKALELDDTLAEAHTALAGIRLTNDYDWSASEREFRRAIELNPGYADAYHWHAHNLMFMSRHEEAAAEIEHARQLDPLSIIINANVGFMYYQARRFDDAIAAERKVLALDAENAVAYEYLGLAYLGKRTYHQAAASLRRAVELTGGAPESLAELAFVYAAAGNTVAARTIIATLQERSRHEYVPSFSLAVAYAGLGNARRALAYLQKAYDERCDLMPTIEVSPLFESLRSDRRFQGLLQQVGFPPRLAPAAAPLPD